MFHQILSQIVKPIVEIAVALFSPVLLDNYIRVTKTVPPQLLLEQGKPGIFFGLPLKGTDCNRFYAGRPMRAEGHVLCSGGPGSGKTQHMVKNTIRTWPGL